MTLNTQPQKPTTLFLCGYVVLTTLFLCLINRSLKLKRSHLAVLARKTVTNHDQVVSEDRHVAVLPFPFSSHASSLLSIVTRLAAATTPNVTFSFYSTSKSIETLFTPAKRVPGNIKPYVVSDGVPDGYVFSGKPQEEINFYIAAVEESLKGVLKAAEAETGQRIGCVMSDAFLWFAGDLAKEMGVPWVSFWCAGANSCAAHFYTDLIMDTVGMHGK
ncbi:hypothetical protein Vadar_008705 [Vaccinium darrowii]|uniref:Uncharacterized protein n=1 Tax=Vaccinium darrowii TaxID=229202 RepID=A0ACB7ZID2_9ERIC|nr:hypothetical protein Vadar_008705 [Vaccinium darrowii]